MISFIVQVFKFKKWDFLKQEIFGNRLFIIG